MEEEQNVPEQKPGKRKLPANRQTGKSEDLYRTTSQDSSIESNKAQTSNIEPQTSNMEVHHHPDLHNKRKHFKEYFLEFIMIFLAVTLGFIAENVRESISDKSKEKEYIASIKKDLAEDTSALNIWIPTLFKRVNDFDTLISLLQVQGVNPYGSDLYYYARLSTRSRIFSANNNTITELKNSGNFRLITNKKIIDRLTNFQKIIDSYVNLVAVDNCPTQKWFNLTIVFK